MSVSVDDIRNKLPVFSDRNYNHLFWALERAQSRVSRAQWGKRADEAIILLTGHFLAIDLQPPATGAVTARTVDDVTESYAAGNDNYASTVYGREYKQLLHTILFDRTRGRRL